MFCKIISEESIGSGIRRITAKTGYDAYRIGSVGNEMLHAIAADLKMKGIANLEAKVANVVEEANELKKQLRSTNPEMLALKANDLENTIEECNGHKLLFANLSGADGNALKDIANNLKAKYEDIVVFLASASEDKITFVACGRLKQRLLMV